GGADRRDDDQLPDDQGHRSGLPAGVSRRAPARGRARRPALPREAIVRPVFHARHLDTWFLLGMTGALLLAFWIVQPSWFTRNLVQEVIAQNTPLALV